MKKQKNPSKKNDGEINERDEWRLACFVITSTIMPWPHQCNDELRNSIETIQEELKKTQGLTYATEILDMPSEGIMKGKQLCGISLWKSVEDLERFVINGTHGKFFARRGEWCSNNNGANVVLWWVKKGVKPTFSDAIKEMERLRLRGPSVNAFNFSKRFDVPITRFSDLLKIILSFIIFFVIIIYVLFVQ
jgi:hypothetical protein